MIITFCGHRDFVATPALEAKLLTILEDTIGDSAASLYLGGYGCFDAFACRCGHKFKQLHPQVVLVYVTPYITSLSAKEAEASQGNRYDEILYPALENVPPRFAITHRNRYMVEQADVVIAYITRSRGGAYQTFQYAQRKGKTVYNLADM